MIHAIGITHNVYSLDVAISLVAVIIFTFFSRLQNTTSNCVVTVIFNVQSVATSNGSIICLALCSGALWC